MAGPTFPVSVPMTEAQAADLVARGDYEIERRQRTPGFSAHNTQAGGQTFQRDLPEGVGGNENTDELRFEPE